MIQIALLGYGTIGSGVAEVLRVNKEIITERAGEEIRIKYILDLRDFPGDPMEDKIVHDYEMIRRDPEVKIVVEAMGGVEPAFTFAKGALLAGKHFATSNKALMAECGSELLSMAKERNLNVLFEASVGGGIPIIRPLNCCLTADVIEEITGILNGTTNYMMSKMAEDGSEFEDVLKDAQQKGYAEADPTADIEGHDACRKIAILTSLVCGQQVDFRDVHTEGITQISAADIKYAKKLGRSIKLLASSYRMGDSYCAIVAPFMLAPENPLYPVRDVFNAVFVHGNMLGDAMFYGSGAGKLPTASAVVSDIIEIAKHQDKPVCFPWDSEKKELVDYRTLENRYFVRTTADRSFVEAAFGAVEYVQAVDMAGETAFVTEKMDGFAFEEKRKRLDGILSVIRVK